MNSSEKTTWLCEYNSSQNRIHVTSLVAQLRSTAAGLEGQVGNGIAIGGFDTLKEAGALANVLENHYAISKEVSNAAKHLREP